MPRAAPTSSRLSRVRLLRQTPGRRAGPATDTPGGSVATIAVDVLGADRGPGELVRGAFDGARDGTHCLLFGPRDDLTATLDAEARGDTEIEIVDAPVAITNDEEPGRAVRSKRNASIVQAAKAVADGRADALVSAGSTGAALAASLLHIKRLPGVYRPAVAVLLPMPSGQLLMLDVGANIEVRPEHLVQFAYMGAAFCERVLGIEQPRVGLLSVGEEPTKGTADVVAAHSTLASGRVRFVGNVEGDELPSGKADVVVTDGFTGNVALKLMEGTSRALIGAIRDAARSSMTSKVGGLLLRPKLAGLRDRFDPETVGGAYLLGLRSPVVICHGKSGRRAIANAIVLAKRGVAEQVVEKTGEALVAAGAERGPTSNQADAEASSAKEVNLAP
jgi:glycerol-3-phosphate acyltransferase PlsX